MKRLGLVIVALGVLAASSVAAPPKSPKHTKKQQTSAAARQEAIKTALINRISIQNDFWYDEGDFPRVVELLRYAYELNPSDYEIATNLGWMLENLEMYGEALAVYQRFRKENPNDPDAPFPEANFYFFRKAYNKIPPLLEKTLDKNPHPNSFRILAHSYDRMGMVKDCVRVWTLYVKLHPEDARGKENLKNAQEKLLKSGKPKLKLQ